MSRDTAVPVDRIRSVVLLGHGGAGKTRLAEALLATAGVTDGREPVLDAEPEEIARGHSLSVAVASLPWRGHRIDLVDTPGLPDAVGDAYPALHAADTAVFVVDAAAGVQPQHDALWESAAALGLPRITVLSGLDQPTAAYQRTVDALRQRYGRPLAPVHMPVGVGPEFTGVVDLLHRTAVLKRDGDRVVTEIPPERREQAERNRESLVEAIVENDDALLERYLEGHVPSAEELGPVFARGIARCGFFPLLCASPAQGIGVRLLADFLVEECPSPLDRDPAATPDGPTALVVVKTLTDPYLGRISVLRVRSGTLAQGDVLTCTRTGAAVRLQHLFRLTGLRQTPVTGARAGEIVAVAKLEDVRTGDVLTAVGAGAVTIPSVPAPEPYHRAAVRPASVGDEDKLSSALARVAEEDPALRVTRDPETGQVLLHAYGPGHVDVTLARMRRKYGVSCELEPVRIAYRETLRGPAEGIGRHVKQSGGHGQYGVCRIEVEPLERGEGFAFVDRIVGGVVPSTFIPSVEKGVRQAMAAGVLAGYPVVDTAVTLLDGKHHSVDSSQLAFEIAGSLAFRDAAQRAGLLLLEPMLAVAVTVPDELTGDVMGDLSARRGRIGGTEPGPPGRTTVLATVPEAELTGYVGELRSLTSGTGTVRMRPAGYEEAPEQVARRVVAAAEETRARSRARA